MPELLLAAKKFGSRLRHHISAWRKRRLAEFLKEHRERVSNGNGEVSAKMTFGEAAAIHLRNLDDNPRIKPSTRDYWRRMPCRASKKLAGPERNGNPQDHARRLQKMGAGLRQNGIADSLQQHDFASSACSERRSGSWRGLQQCRSGCETCAGAVQRNRAAEYRQIQCADCGDACGPQPRLNQLRRFRLRLGIHRLPHW